MAQNENITLSLGDKIDILNKTQSLDARYGVYDSEIDALAAMQNYGLDGRQVAVYTDKPNGKVQLYLYNGVLHQLEPISGGGGGGIESVTGDLVDNTDPLNPIVNTPNITLEQARQNGNVLEGDIELGSSAQIFQGVTDYQNSQDMFTSSGFRFVYGDWEGFVGILDGEDGAPYMTYYNNVTNEARKITSQSLSISKGDTYIALTTDPDNECLLVTALNGANHGKGIDSDEYYGANYTDNTYVQKKYVDDEISAIPIPTKTSDLINDGADNTSTYVEHDELAPVATSNDYEDLDNLPNLLVLGETSTTAYRGDRGKTAYEHSQGVGNPHKTTLQQVVDENGTVEDELVSFTSATPNSPRVDINNEQVKIEDVTEAASVKIGFRDIEFEHGGNKLSVSPVTVDDDYTVVIQAKDHTLAGLDDVALSIETAGFLQRTGTEIAFDKWATYDSYGSPSDGNFSYDLTNAVVGMIQVAYHEDSLVPTFTQVGLDIMITGEYQPDVVNKIAFELIALDRILINIKAL
jgi:hypothetical protein